MSFILDLFVKAFLGLFGLVAFAITFVLFCFIIIVVWTTIEHGLSGMLDKLRRYWVAFQEWNRIR
nr:hypothetical protein BN993_02871 [Virgibacillus halodenitrificans]